MTKNCSEYNHIKHMKIITEGELPELVITESWMESHIVTQLNIPVAHSLIPKNRKTGMNGSWLQDPGMVRRGEQPIKMKMDGK